jgi:prepilin-type N-terminal cleavage/methylation domain-containing protein
MRKNQQKGFTLVELLVYISLVSIAMMVIMTFFVDVTTSATKITIAKEVQQSARFILQQMTHDIRNAQAVVSVHQSAIELQAQNGDFLRYETDGGALQRRTNGGAAEILTSNAVALQSVQFLSAGDTIAITISLQQSAAGSRPSNRAAITLQTSVAPRRSLY